MVYKEVFVLFEYSTPESVGISSKKIENYIKNLNEQNVVLHDMIMLKDNKIFYEGYWKPFKADFSHRWYSVTKSIVSLAVGFLIQEGNVSLDDKIVDVLPKEYTEGLNPRMELQTIRNMLMMSTGFPMNNWNWFKRKPADRVKDYFSVSKGKGKIPGSYFV